MTQEASPLGFFHGLGSFFRAFGVLRKQPKILGWMSIPFGLTVLIDGALMYFTYGWLHDLLERWLGDSWLSFLAGFLLVLALAFVAFWSFAFIFLTASDLVLDYISEAVEEAETGQAGNGPEGVSHTIRGIVISLQQMVLLTALQLLMLVVGLIPVLGQVALFGFTIWALGYAMFSIPSGRKLHSLGERLSLARVHLRGVMGLGLIAFVVAFVPLLNLLLLPVFVVSGTLLFLDTQRSSAS